MAAADGKGAFVSLLASEPLACVGFDDARREIIGSRLTLIECHDGTDLAGVLLAELETSPVLIHRVLVSHDYRRHGPRAPTPSVMGTLGHALIAHAIECSPDDAETIEFQLAELACVVAHSQKWQHIFARAGRTFDCAIEIIPSASPKQSARFIVKRSNSSSALLSSDRAQASIPAPGDVPGPPDAQTAGSETS